MYEWIDKRKYIGEWKNNKMDGNGEFFWPGISYNEYNLIEFPFFYRFRNIYIIN